MPKAPITIGIIVTFMFHSFFNSLARSRYLSLFSHSFSFILWSAGTAKSTILQIFFSRLGDPFACQNPIGVCVCHFLGHIPFVSMAKFEFLAHFSVDHLAHPVVSSLVLLLCQFAAFTYYVIDGFICHHIAYICYFVASYLFSPWYDWFLWRCFVLPLGEILLLTQSFLFLAMSRFCRVRCCLLVV